MTSSIRALLRSELHESHMSHSSIPYLRTGFLIETHHVFFVYLTLQGELLSELSYLRANTSLLW